MATKGNRTRSGGVSAAARKKYGGGPGIKKGAFPVFNAKSAKSALDLRGHDGAPMAVVTKVARFANRTGNSTVKKEVAAIRNPRSSRRGR